MWYTRLVSLSLSLSRGGESSLPVAHPGYQVLSDILFRLGLIPRVGHGEAALSTPGVVPSYQLVHRQALNCHFFPFPASCVWWSLLFLILINIGGACKIRVRLSTRCWMVYPGLFIIGCWRVDTQRRTHNWGNSTFILSIPTWPFSLFPSSSLPLPPFRAELHTLTLQGLPVGSLAYLHAY